jgi:pimeloyl-ACP methyl ester carboxylesterase
MPWRPWAPRTITVPEPDEAGTIDGLAYALYRPEAECVGGVVVCHGAGSAKENHLDFARACRAHGLACAVFDQRGHGATGGALDARAIEDVGRIASLLGAGPIGLRGSSMGGWLVLAAAGHVGASAVVAICPASGEGLLRGLRDGRLDFSADIDALETLIETHDTTTAGAAALGERLLLLHAEGDEVVPVERSRALHAAAPGSRYVEVPGGHHRSVQHDNDLQAVALRFLRRRLLGAEVADHVADGLPGAGDEAGDGREHRRD